MGMQPTPAARTAHLWLAPGLVFIILQLKGQDIGGAIHSPPLLVQLSDVGIVAHHQAQLHRSCRGGWARGGTCCCSSQDCAVQQQ